MNSVAGAGFVRDWLGIETLFVEPRVLVSAKSPLADLTEVSVESLVDQPFVARKSPDAWRTLWLAADSRQGLTVQLGAEVSTVDECSDAIQSARGMAFSQTAASQPVSPLRRVQ